ncbi:MAG: molecular chaperone DnaJ, partial [Candidatus Rokubacteria bacterium]|nr:molecular chaperone DnaJ [Candidatus Rokubacteria bacterium]
GVEDGSQLRLSGEGAVGTHGAPPGDLYVVIRVRPHDFFVRRGPDLYCELPLTFPQLALGTEVEVPILGGKARLRVPSGTQPGEIVRLQGKGMPTLGKRGRGDICYQVVLEVPTKLGPKQRQLLEEFQHLSGDEPGPLFASFVKRMKRLLGS